MGDKMKPCFGGIQNYTVVKEKIEPCIIHKGFDDSQNYTVVKGIEGQ